MIPARLVGRLVGSTERISRKPGAVLELYPIVRWEDAIIEKLSQADINSTDSHQFINSASPSYSACSTLLVDCSIERKFQQSADAGTLSSLEKLLPEIVYCDMRAESFAQKFRCAVAMVEGDTIVPLDCVVLDRESGCFQAICSKASRPIRFWFVRLWLAVK